MNLKLIILCVKKKNLRDQLVEEAQEPHHHLPQKTKLGVRKKLIKILKPVVIYSPFLMLFMNGISGLSFDKSWFDWFNWYQSQITGASILPQLIQIYFALVFNYCIYSWIAITTLLLMNVVNIYYANDWAKFESYSEVYSSVIVCLSIICFTLFLFNKWKTYCYK